MIRKVFAALFFLGGVGIWWFSSDLLKLIAMQDEVLFGLYSRQRFGQLFLGSLILWSLAYLFGSNMKFGRDMLFNVFMIVVSTVTSVLVVILGSQWLLKPRYVEETISQTQAGIQVEGVVRHRTPNEYRQLSFEDRPVNHRSYPDAPAGFGRVELELTTDKYGYRNKDLQDQYDVVIVGDSFVAGSQISDEHTWPQLLSDRIETPVYNLGVSGSDPQTYLNNFVKMGLQLKPKLVVFMVYEGNDFRSKGAKILHKEDESLNDRVSFMMKHSPVTKGLRRLSHNVIEKINSDAPVDEWHQKLGFMPVTLTSENGMASYAFKPKRMVYLLDDEPTFEKSAQWTFARSIFNSIKKIADDKGIRLVFVYAPSKAHVILDIVGPDTPAAQLNLLASYRKKSMPNAEEFKQKLLANMDSQEQVMAQFCEENDIEFVSTTPMLTDMTRQGHQTYYTYDQHWSPTGNRLVAELVSDYLSP